MNTKYTFLLPAFKAKYLGKMLSSIQNQVFTDFKVIISDDCSPEDIYSVCEPYLSDKRFSYRRNSENMGTKSVVGHWNLLVDMCDTEYLIMASDDDYYATNFLEEIDRLTIKYPQVGILSARIQNINQDDIITFKDLCYDEYMTQLEFIHHKFSWNGHIHCMQNNVFKTSVLKEVGGCVDFPLAWYSDDATVIVAAKNGVVYTSSILFNFRNSDIQISSNSRITSSVAKKKVESGFLFINWIKPIISDIMIDGQLYLRNLKSNALHKSVHYIGGLVKYYYAYMSFGDFCKCYHSICETGIIKTRIEKYLLLKDWIKNHI